MKKIKKRSLEVLEDTSNYYGSIENCRYDLMNIMNCLERINRLKEDTPFNHLKGNVSEFSIISDLKNKSYHILNLVRLLRFKPYVPDCIEMLMSSTQSRNISWPSNLIQFMKQRSYSAKYDDHNDSIEKIVNNDGVNVCELQPALEISNLCRLPYGDDGYVDQKCVNSVVSKQIDSIHGPCNHTYELDTNSFQLHPQDKVVSILMI